MEKTQRAEWLKHKGMDTFEAMQLYIEKVKQLALVYQERKKDSTENWSGLKYAGVAFQLNII